MTKTLSDYLVFTDPKLQQRWGDGPVPMSTLYDAYFDGAIDIPGDLYDFLRNRKSMVKYSLTWTHLKWAVTNFIPEVAIHSKDQDRRIVREHYDRGNDFFGWFLGERMVYTSGFFQSPSESLEKAQDNKMELVCRKLQLEQGERLLDIGCGWGTLTRHAARYHGVDATGVTIAERQTEFGNKRIADWGLSKTARIECRDYRDIPGGQKFDKISSLEMVEHVGVKNLRAFYDQVHELLADDGLFLLQWTGLRRGLRPEDLIWGLFMNRYIFPGADASLCPSAMLKVMEKAKFESHSVENISTHYGWTIKRWYDNWESNRAEIVAAYGDRWFRIWRFFLAWSTIIAEQGNAACFQVILHKNADQFDRTRWIRQRSPILGEAASRLPADEHVWDVGDEQPAAAQRSVTAAG